MLQGESIKTLPAELEVLSPFDVRLTITEGRYHQVKRMFAAMGNRVVSLHRVQVGWLVLDVSVGGWRELTPLEISRWKRPAVITKRPDSKAGYFRLMVSPNSEL